MLYFSNPVRAARPAMIRGLLGCIVTPGQGNVIPPGSVWFADNGRFSGKKDDEGRPLVGDRAPRWKGDLWFEAWLARPEFLSRRSDCRFVVAPDVPFDHEATMSRAMPWLYRIRAMGYPAALTIQNGIKSSDRLPWANFDVMFIAGDMGFKHGLMAAELTRQAVTRGIPVHWGRGNALKRIRQAHGMGCSSMDGGFLRYGPDSNLPELLGWLSDLDRNGAQTFL